MYSVDLEMIRNIINELNSASAGAGSNMEHILVGLENVWNDSRKGLLFGIITFNFNNILLLFCYCFNIQINVLIVVNVMHEEQDFCFPENETRLQILEENQEKLEDFKDLREKLDSCIQEKEKNVVSQLSEHSEAGFHSWTF